MNTLHIEHVLRGIFSRYCSECCQSTGRKPWDQR